MQIVYILLLISTADKFLATWENIHLIFFVSLYVFFVHSYKNTAKMVRFIFKPRHTREPFLFSFFLFLNFHPFAQQEINVEENQV